MTTVKRERERDRSPPRRSPSSPPLPPHKRLKPSPPSSPSPYPSPSHPPPHPQPKQSINLSLSGLLNSSTPPPPPPSSSSSSSSLSPSTTYHPPSDACLPSLHYRLYSFPLPPSTAPPTTLYVHRQPHYTIGRDPASHLPLSHPSISKAHAVLQYRRVKGGGERGGGGGEVRPYIIDLGSVNGTWLNGERVESARYYELRERDVLRFGGSGREFVLLHADSQGGGGRSEGRGRGVAGDERKEGEELAGEGAGAVKKRRPAWAEDDDDY